MAGDISASVGDRVSTTPADVSVPARQPLTILSAYGAMTIPLAASGLPIAIYVAPLYTDHIGLGLTTVGLVLMATRLFDLIIDPFVGRLTDATRSPLGRRLPWILVGVPVMMLGTWRLFLPTEDATAYDLFLWMAIFYFGWALITVPYAAWGAELSDNYHERSRIAGVRELWSVVGLLLAVSMPLLVRYEPVDPTATKDMIETAAIASDVAALGVATVVLLPLCALILIWKVPIIHTPSASGGWSFRQMSALARNRPFMLLFASTLFAGLSTGMSQTTVVHYYRHRAGLAEEVDLLIFLFFAAALFGAVFWVWIGRKIAKHHAVAWSSLLAVAAAAAILLVPAGDFAGFAIIQIATGMAYAGPLILGASMAADVIDFDWLRSGFQRSALFIAAFGIAKKLAEAAGVGIALPLMEVLGFDPAQGGSDASQQALIIVNVALPALFGLAAIPPILAYPITEARQRRIRAAITRRYGDL